MEEIFALILEQSFCIFVKKPGHCIRICLAKSYGGNFAIRRVITALLDFSGYTQFSMPVFTIILVSLSVAMDALSVSLAISTCGLIRDNRGKIRLAAHFGIFQSGMTLLGWFAGETMVRFISPIDHWLAMALLGYVAYGLIRAGLNPEAEAFPQDPSKGRTMILLAVATSIDAFAVGMSLPVLKLPFGWTTASIGLVTFALSCVGLFAGHNLGERFGRRMQVVGGVVLLIIAVNVVVGHLFPQFSLL